MNHEVPALVLGDELMYCDFGGVGAGGASGDAASGLTTAGLEPDGVTGPP